MVDRIMRKGEVCGVLGLSKSTIYAMIKDGRFPAPTRIGQRASGWPESKVSKWIADRVAGIQPPAR